MPTFGSGPWGRIPVDGDVRPFSMFNPYREDTPRSNRKHHFISIVYMNGFTDAQGRVQVYRSEDPHKPHPMQPSATGFQNYYYSQRLPDGGQENHRFEDLWGLIETVWPETMRALEDRRLSPAISFNVLGMQSIMFARVPATRDRHAVLLEAKLRSEAKILEELGSLPERFERYAGQFDTVPVGINPQQTLLAMKGEFKKLGDLCFKLGFEVLHNQTGSPLLTSDNPVCFYNPAPPLVRRVPYDRSGEVELIFPLTSKMLLRGSSKRGPANVISRHRDITDPAAVRRLNRTIAQFAYRITLGQDRSCDDLVRAHAALVPTVSTEVRREGKAVQIVWRHLFGPRPKLSGYIDTPEKAARLEASMAEAANNPQNEGTEAL